MKKQAAAKKSHMAGNYCPECAEEIRKLGEQPERILDPNLRCACCGRESVCPNYCGTEERPNREIFCRECLDEMDAYLSRIAEVNKEINAVLRQREKEGWTPVTLVIDANFVDRGVREMQLRRGMTLNLLPEPLVFAVAIVSERPAKTKMMPEATLDFVSLCPSAIKRLLQSSLRHAAADTGVDMRYEGGIPS